MTDPDRVITVKPGNVVIVDVDVAGTAPAVRLEALEDGTVRLLPAKEGGPGPFVHDDRQRRGAPAPPESPRPHG